VATAATKLQNGCLKSCGYYSTLGSHDSGHSHNKIAEFSHTAPKKHQLKKMAMAAMKLQNGCPPKSCSYYSTLGSHDSGHSHNKIAEFSHTTQKMPAEKKWQWLQ